MDEKQLMQIDTACNSDTDRYYCLISDVEYSYFL